ncbi:ABC-type branched-subunit amino acid transport system ATPase component/ABC-type branched-subunit amino acid transport system permease subunit [Bradyrhizobium elkanii]
MTALSDVSTHAMASARWRVSEVAFWALALACAFLFPSRYLIMTDIVRLGLFALSLDLILGYAGIVSLGHAAFFGVGAYSAGLLALHGIVNEPVIALVAAGLVAALLGFLTSFLVIRGVDLTRLMVTLGIALLLEALAERFSNITGGTDGLQGIEMQPILGLFTFDMFGKTGFFYSLIVLFILFLLARRIVHSPFGLSLRAIKNNPLRAAAIGVPVNRRLIAVYTLAGFYAGIAGALFTQTTALASLDVFSFERSADLMLRARDRRHRLSLRRPHRGRRVQDAAGAVSEHHPAILAVLDRPRAGRDRAGRPRAHPSLGAVRAQPDHPPVRLPQGRRCRAGERRVMTIALETRRLEKSFGALRVTRDLSLKVMQGARHALIGPNGAGKTTVINQLTGVLTPNSGRILLEGSDITGLSVHKRVLRGLSRTFQINQLYPDLTPLETIGLAVSERMGHGGDWWRRMGTRSDVNTEIAEILSRFHLLDVMTELTSTLPYGKQRLLEIAVAIAAKPRVLLLDEPAAGVPESERHDILAAVAALPRDVTVLLIEHDMDLVFSFADRISVLVNGGLLAEGAPDEVARDPQVRAVYLGEAADA